VCMFQVGGARQYFSTRLFRLRVISNLGDRSLILPSWNFLLDRESKYVAAVFVWIAQWKAAGTGVKLPS